jgi:hypothetical protein
MADTENVSKLPELAPEIPDFLRIEGTPSVRISANTMRALKAETGRTMTELMSETASEEDRMQTMAWLEARRQGLDISWADAGAVDLEFSGAAPDPTNVAP